MPFNHRGPIPRRPGEPAEPDGKTALMEVVVRWEYLHAQVHADLDRLEDVSDPEMERAVVHELLHCIVKEMREEENQHKHEERAVSHLTNIVFWILDEAYREGKRARQ